MTEVDLSSFDAIVASVDASSRLPGMRERRPGIGGLSIHRAEDVAGAARRGSLGLLPLGKLANGDEIGLRASLGAPVERWPIVHVRGGGSKTIAWRLADWVAHAVLFDEADALEQGDRAHANVEAWDALGRFFGDGGRAGALVREIRDGARTIGHRTRDIWSVADPDGAWPAWYRALDEALLASDGGVSAIHALTDRWPELVPARWTRLRMAVATDDHADAGRSLAALLARPLGMDAPLVVPALCGVGLVPPPGLGEDATDAWHEARARLSWSPLEVRPAIAGALAAAAAIDPTLALLAGSIEASAFASAAASLETRAPARALVLFDTASTLIAWDGDAESEEEEAADAGAARCAARVGDPILAAVYALAVADPD